MTVRLDPEQPVALAAGAAAPRRVLAWLRALRPFEWSKNVFVVAPLIFGDRADRWSSVRPTLFELVAFCFAASAGYLFNDLRDRAADREHPRKRHRPLASGAVSVRLAVVSICLLSLAAVGASVAAGLVPCLLLVIYLAITATYTLALKHMVIADVMTIAGLFLLRVEAGSSAAGVPASHWIIVCTGSVALLLGFSKRRQEAMSTSHRPQLSRSVLEQYSVAYLDQTIPMLAAVTIVAYVLYTLNSPTIGDRMLPTAAPVTYGVLRYQWLMYHRGETRDASALVFGDPGMLFAGVSWLLLAAGLLYL